MPSSILAGTRIRDIRTAKRIKQAELAILCEISPSYLNLIEHNRRRIGGALLLKIAAALEVDASSVSEGADSSLTTALEAAAQAASSVSPEIDQMEALASRFPGWASLVAHQYSEVRRLEQVVARLGDRLTHDPYLSASMHNVLTSVTAIRSASAILASGEAVEPEWQARFHRNIYEDSRRLADATETLVSYLDTDAEGAGGGTLPQEEVDLWLAKRQWHFEELEVNPDVAIDGIISDAEELQSGASQGLARRYLAQYATDVRAVQASSILEMLAQAASSGQIAAELRISLPTVFRRLASLKPEDLPNGKTVYGLVGCDGSGTLTLRKPVPGFDLPRYSGACPLWPLFQALQQPMALVSSELLLSGREELRFRAEAVCEVDHPMGYDRPASLTAWMLIQEHATGDPEGQPRRIGTTCRVCAEKDCSLRREASVFSSVLTDAL